MKVSKRINSVISRNKNDFDLSILKDEARRVREVQAIHASCKDCKFSKKIKHLMRCILKRKSIKAYNICCYFKSKGI